MLRDEIVFDIFSVFSDRINQVTLKCTNEHYIEFYLKKVSFQYVTYVQDNNEIIDYENKACKAKLKLILNLI